MTEAKPKEKAKKSDDDHTVFVGNKPFL